MKWVWELSGYFEKSVKNSEGEFTPKLIRRRKKKGEAAAAAAVGLMVV